MYGFVGANWQVVIDGKYLISKAHCDIPIILIKRLKEKIFSGKYQLNKSNEGIIPELF
ncbi:hypothetical protein D030_1396 [Vibrio parahaemolyticus AQ3810]|nr:hypothetical protein D030_1396 [Vibrio parahaemolyticus AQ3810]